MGGEGSDGLGRIEEATSARRRGVEEHWLSTKGKKVYLKYLEGERLSRAEALVAKCAECMNGYADGRRDCEVVMCPLYPYMPYKKGGPMKNRSRRKGMKITEEQKRKMREGRRKK